MPIYEYRCPEGHTFERFQSMTAPPPETCEVCGASPLELVLYPVAIHYKGSGFYSTDYGKRTAAKKEGDGGGASSSDGGSSTSDSGTSSSSSTAADSKPKPASSGDSA